MEHSSIESNTNIKKGIRKLLLLYDFFVFIISFYMIMVRHPSLEFGLSQKSLVIHFLVGSVCLLSARMFADVYRQIWRYGSIQAFLRLILADIGGGFVYICITRLAAVEGAIFIRSLSLLSVDLLGAISIRIIYYFIYQESERNTRIGFVLRNILKYAGAVKVKPEDKGVAGARTRRIKIAIVGAGRIGVGLAEDLIENPRAAYEPVCFIDINEEKIGRLVSGLFVIDEKQATPDYLSSIGIQEVVFALPSVSPERKKELYDYYTNAGCKVKIFDYPTMQDETGGRRQLREFQAEELLFRTPESIIDDKTYAFYRNKVILVTGGGGSIGSELCRQIVKMNPRKLIILDVYENGAYDIQQEIRMNSSEQVNLCVEILSVCDKNQLNNIFERYKPDIVIHAAAHKHVPLMEHNCCEAVKNNVFGTLNVVECSIKYKVQRFMMVSTDKAVNPTNVMGATKRMCEMIVQSKSASRVTDGTTFSMTRFGNVLGSAGSVIPLFKKQIAKGGPVTLTDKRIIRYFMTIPEASQLVLKSGAMAKNGELFVLDMGQPVRILELAENMIRLSGLEPYRDIEIKETGLRPGEKLYEELLVKGENLSSTDDSKIFIEKDRALSDQEISEKLNILIAAVDKGNDQEVKEALMRVVPTFKAPEVVNSKVNE